eukprot:325625_1
MPLLYNHFVNDYGMSSSTAWRVCMVVPACLYLVLSVVYWVFTVDKPSDVNNPPKKKKAEGVFKVGAGDYRTWILSCGYAACFGIELTVLRFCVGYLMDQFGMTQSMAGFIVLCFSLCNLFARSIGGIIADIVSRYSSESLHGRVLSLFIIIITESVFLILFAFGAHPTWINSLGYTITTLICFSLCVQAAEGATFAIVPFVQPKAIGPTAGIVGAGGNMGAMLFAFCIFTQVPVKISWFAAWLILGLFVFVVSFSVLGVRFTEAEINAADETMNTWTEMERDAEAERGDFKPVPTQETGGDIET